MKLITDRDFWLLVATCTTVLYAGMGLLWTFVITAYDAWLARKDRDASDHVPTT